MTAPLSYLSKNKWIQAGRIPFVLVGKFNKVCMVLPGETGKIADLVDSPPGKFHMLVLEKE